jgi:hypothetical protein
MDAKGKERTRAQRAAGTKNTALFDIVNRDDGQRLAARAAAPHARVPGERSDLGATRRIAVGSHVSLRESSRWIPALVPFGFASLHSGYETETLFGRGHLL